MTVSDSGEDFLYPIPDGEPAARVQDPAFGALDILTGHKEKRGKGVLMPPTSYLVLPERTIGLPLKPISFKALLQAELKASGLAGGMINEGFGRNTIVRWTPSLHLLDSARRLVDPNEMGAVPTEVSDAFVAGAAAMVAEIDLGAFRDVVFDVLALPAVGPVIRSVSYELEATLETEMQDAKAAAAGGMANLITSRLSLDDVGELANIYAIPGPVDPDPIEASPVTYHHDPGDETRYRRGYLRRDRNRCLVRPAFVAGDEFVQTLGMKAGVAVVARGEMKGDEADVLPQLLLHADAIHPLPALRALVAPGLRLVSARHGSRDEFEDVAPVTNGAFDPWDPVTTCKAASWVSAHRSTLREARSVVVDATGGEPLAIFSCTLEEVPGIVGSSDTVLRYATNLGDDDCILPWWASQAATAEAYRPNTYEVDLEEYRRELAAEVLREMRPGARRPVAEVAARLQRLTKELETIARPAVAEARALQCPAPVLRAIENPLGALLAALRAATEARLLREHRAGEVALAALLAVAAADDTGATDEPDVS